MPKDLSIEHDIFLKWLPMTCNARSKKGWPTSTKGMALFLNMSYIRLRQWKAELKSEQASDIGEDIGDDTLDKRIKGVDDMSYMKAVADKSTPRDREIFFKRHGLLVDKSEQKVEHSFGPSDYAEVTQKIWERLSELIPERCRGVCPLLNKPLLLPEKLREDSGREPWIDTVGTMAPPSIPS